MLDYLRAPQIPLGKRGGGGGGGEGRGIHNNQLLFGLQNATATYSTWGSRTVM